MIVVPFTNNITLLILHFMFSISMMAHWILNNDTCALTLIEKYFRNCNTDESFIHSLVSPIYNVSENELANYIYIISFALISITFYKLYNHPDIPILFNQIKNYWKSN